MVSTALANPWRQARSASSSRAECFTSRLPQRRARRLGLRCIGFVSATATLTSDGTILAVARRGPGRLGRDQPSRPTTDKQTDPDSGLGLRFPDETGLGGRWTRQPRIPWSRSGARWRVARRDGQLRRPVRRRYLRHPAGEHAARSHPP